MKRGRVSSTPISTTRQESECRGAGLDVETVLLRELRAPFAMWRLSTAYVAANRFRTGLTLTMFALVVLSLTVSAVMLTATRVAYADPDAVTGGWDIHAESTLPARDLRADLAAGGVVSPEAFSAIGAASPLLIEGVQTDSARARWASVRVLEVDDAYCEDGTTVQCCCTQVVTPLLAPNRPPPKPPAPCSPAS